MKDEHTETAGIKLEIFFIKSFCFILTLLAETIHQTSTNIQGVGSYGKMLPLAS